MKFREINKKLREAQYFTLAGKPIENDEDIRAALHDILGVGGDSSVEAVRAAVELLTKQKNKSRMVRQLLNDLEMIVRKFSLPIGRFHYSTLQHALNEGTEYAIRHRETKKTLSTHTSKESAQDELDGLGDKKNEYQIVKTAQPPREFSVNENEDLMEVEMSPSAFRKFLNSPEAEGIRAGFEAELIFRDTQREGDDEEYEPDYDADERAYDIESVVDFFQGGDNGIGRNAANRLRDSLYEDWQEWQRDSFFNNYWDENQYRETIEQADVWEDEEEEYLDRAREELESAAEGKEVSDEAVEERARELFDEDVSDSFDQQDRWYSDMEERAWDDYRDNEASEEEWLSENYRWMSDISSGYDVDWPYWRGGNSNGASRTWEDIGNGLERAVGMPVRVSSGYHGATRRDGQYIIEPDGSLDPDDSDEAGLEIVSPPMPLAMALEQLQKVIDWASGSGDAYTNSSTGLHMGVSLPFKGGDVDPVKLILFMGDKNILEKFDRESNHYARSAYDRLKNKISSMKDADAQQVAGIMELMKKNLIELADRELKKGVLGDKYVSVNPHDGYIEFRGPGGDYLSLNDRDPEALENTMLRLAYAMHIAGRADLHRQEYAKKLYKMLTAGDRANPFMQLFADYSAGTLTGQELKARWADRVLDMEREKEAKANGQARRNEQGYEVYDRDTGRVLSQFLANSDQEAIDRALEKYSGQGISYGVRKIEDEPSKDKQSSRRAELAKRVTRSTRDVGEQLWRVNHHSSFQFVTARSQAEAVSKAVEKDRAFDNPATRARIATDAERQQYQMDQERERQRAVQAQAGEPRPAGGEFTGTWIIRDGQGRELHRFSGIGNSQADANRFAAGWLGRNRPNMVGQEVDVVPEMR